MTFDRPEPSPSLPLLLGEPKVAITPMGEKLRVSGILELSGLDLSIQPRRVDTLLPAVLQYIALRIKPTGVENWSGLRPCTPDGLPVIGRSRSLDNLVIATGHGMLGISLGPITGKLVAQLVAGEATSIDLNPFGPDRFR